MIKKNENLNSTGKTKRSPKLIIFTDLDGTLLDSGYSFEKALPALKLIKQKNIPLILCSSKTGSEIEKCRKKLKNDHPFIAENGGGLYIPVSNYKLQISDFKMKVEKGKTYYLIKLGADYIDLRKALQELRSEGFDVRGFGDMSVKEITELTGLKMTDAKMAKKRDFDEPFVFYGDEAGVRKLKQRIKAKGFNYTRGVLFHIMGESDKGRAVEILMKMYEKQYGRIITAALGDSPNDMEMLLNADYPVVVKKIDGKYDAGIIRKVKGCIKAEGVGSEGWNRAVIELIDSLM